jgi:hypothetical protein
MRFIFQIYEIHELKRIAAQPFAAIRPLSLRTVVRLAHYLHPLSKPSRVASMQMRNASESKNIRGARC